VKIYAVRQGLRMRDNHLDRLPLADVAREIGIDGRGTAASAVKSLGLKIYKTRRGQRAKRGSAGIALLSMAGAATLRAYYPPIPPDTFDTNEAARRLHYAPATVLNLIKRGEIRAVRWGVRWRIPLAEIERLRGSRLLAWSLTGPLVGKDVEAGCNLACAYPPGPTWLVPWLRDQRIAVRRGAALGRVVGQHANRLEVETAFGLVAIAAELVREVVAQEATEGPGDRQRQVVLALAEPRPAASPKPPKAKGPHPWRRRWAA
jgi:excisionase family DNA binding protein